MRRRRAQRVAHAHQGLRRAGGVGVVAAAASLMLGAPAPHAAAAAESSNYDLPVCEADAWVDGLAVERWADGEFKVVLTPTVDGRVFAVDGINSMWHLIQACVPGLYDELADSIYAQLACHADLSWLPDAQGEGFATGPTWDLESYRTPTTEWDSVWSKCSGYAPNVARTESGDWEVYFGVDPQEKLDQDLAALQAAPNNAKASGVPVHVAFTGGVGLWARTGPGGAADRIEVLPEGTEMQLLCQSRGELIQDWVSTDLWDFVSLHDGRNVWVSDAFVQTGAMGQVAPDC